MRLYSGSSSDFVAQSTGGHIASRLADAFFARYRHRPSPSEEESWRNSLKAMGSVILHSGLNDHGVALEYELPMSSSRLDCLITGADSTGRDGAVIVELKQWSECCIGDGDRVVTFVGGNRRDVLHPSIQVDQYRLYLQDMQTAFHEGESPVLLSACSYLHNYRHRNGDPIFDPKYSEAVRSAPVFTSGEAEKLSGFLKERLGVGRGMSVLQKIDKGRYSPSKKLLDHVGRVLDGRTEYVLLDEQLVAFDRVVTEARRGMKSEGKAAILVRGGPGTGKSVIALNLLAALSAEGFNSHYVTGSRAFTETLREIVGRRAAGQVKFFNSYMSAACDAIDVMICDESHRIRETSNGRFTKADRRTNLKQIDELLQASKVAVFFIDDKQVVRPNETGSSITIRAAAEKIGSRVFDYELEAQFRCAGSDSFVRWVSNTLEIERTASVLWNTSNHFDFRILPSPDALDQEIRDRAHEGSSARMTAGFCWKWSNPMPDGRLVEDVKVGEFQRPWNAKSDAGHLDASVPPEKLWAYDARGVDQVGCIYTAQGFEFDYVGVIFGPDLIYRHGQGWLGQKDECFDSVVKRSGTKFVDLVKNTYRVLLTRGMKGCYVHFMDKETEKFFTSRMESA